jgi:hypothetical protein
LRQLHHSLMAQSFRRLAALTSSVHGILVARPGTGGCRWDDLGLMSTRRVLLCCACRRVPNGCVQPYSL